MLGHPGARRGSETLRASWAVCRLSKQYGLTASLRVTHHDAGAALDQRELCLSVYDADGNAVLAEREREC